MGKFSDNIYAMNESLLDDVETEEVVDDEEDGTARTAKYRFVFNFASGRKIQRTKSLFFDSAMEPALNRMKNAGLVLSWDFDKKAGKPGDFPGIDTYSYCVYGVDADRAFDSPVTLSVDVGMDASAETPDTLVSISAYMMQAVLASDLSIGDMRIAFWQAADRIKYVHYYYSICFSNGKWLFYYGHDGHNYPGTCRMLAGCFVKAARKLGIIEPVDDAGTRYIAYSYGQAEADRLMFIIASDGKCLANYVVDLMAVDNGKYLDNRLMYVQFASGRQNYLKMDGTKLEPDDFCYCSKTFSDGYASVSRYDRSRRTESNLIDKDGNALLDEWCVSAENFVDGLAIISKRMPDGNRNTKNFIDRSGKPVLPEWYMNIDFGDGENNGKRNVAMVAYKTAEGPVKYKYVDRDGEDVYGEWLTGSCSAMKNGFAIVCKFKGNRSIYNYMREDGTLVSDEWFSAVCGWPERGIFAFEELDGKWQFRETGSGKLLFGGTVFDKVSGMNANDGFKYYYVTLSSAVDNKTYNNLISADGVMCCDKTDAWDVSYAGNGFATVRKEYAGDSVLWKWGEGPVELGMELSGACEWDNSEYTLVTSKDYKHNIIDRNGKPVSDEWFDYVGHYVGGFFTGWKGRGEDAVANVIACKTGKRLFGPEGFGVNKICEAVPDRMVIVDAWFSNTLKYNVFDCDGNRLLAKWTEFRIMPLDNGLLKVGPASYIDYSGKMAGLI